VQTLLTPCLSVPLAITVSLLLALLVCQPGTGLRLLLVVAVPPLVCQSGTGLYVLLAITVLLLLPLLVCQLGTCLCVLLAVAAPLLVCQSGTHHLFLKCTFEGNVYLHTHISLPLEFHVVFLLHKLQLHKNCQAFSRKYHNVLTPHLHFLIVLVPT
jgi:hypothetical protein